MRRALITNEFAPTHGGVERLLYERARGFQPASLTVFTAHTPGCESFDAQQAYRSSRSGRYLGAVPLIKDVVRSLAPMQACYRQHRRQRFAALECGQTFPACLFAWWLHRKYGTPYLVWVHGNDLLGPSRYRLLRGVIRSSLLQAQAIITNSSYTAGVVAEFGIPAKNIRVIAPLVDTDKFRPAAPSSELLHRYGFGQNKVALTVCRLVERKGVDVTLRAISSLRDKHPDLRYLIVGEGPMRQELERLVRHLGLAGCVVFAGNVPESELAAHYNLASLFVMPSRFLQNEASVEGLGLVYLEAMASAVPIVAGRSGGVPDIVLDGNNGLLVDPQSVKDVSTAMDLLLSDENYATKLGNNGLAFVHRPRDWSCLEL